MKTANEATIVSGRTVVVMLIMLSGCAETRDAPGSVPDSATIAQPTLPVVDSGAPSLLPVDEADSSFAEFRRTALRALAAHDTLFLYSILAPEIKSSFGGDDGRAGFDRVWRMEHPDSSPVWSALTHVLELGGSMRGEYFVAPYVYAEWPDSLDAFQMVAVTGENVAAYSEPDTSAAPIGRLVYSILPVEDFPFERSVDRFARVRLPDGRSVWVRAVDVYSPVGWRAFFEQRDGRWIMTILVAGD